MLSSFLSKLVVKNIKTGRPSYVLTAFISGFLMVNIKLLVSGLEINGIKMSDFSGVDYGAAVAALGGIYTLNKKVRLDNIEENKEQ